jgi:hypothetical protein
VGERPELILTDTPGEALQVDVLVYPEDTYLVVDPYSPLEEPKESAAELIAEVQAALPRPLGEILPARAAGVEALRVLRLVLLDFNQRRPCGAGLVAETLRRVIREGARLQARDLGLDRFELLGCSISAYGVLSSMCGEVERLELSGGLPPKKLIFSLHQPAALRRYQMALANLPERCAPDSGSYRDGRRQ